MSETYTDGGNTLVWDCYVCPNCGGRAPMGLMSVIARCCDCGWVYIQDGYATGWYESVEAYRAGAVPILITRTSDPNPHPASLQPKESL